MKFRGDRFSRKNKGLNLIKFSHTFNQDKKLDFILMLQIMIKDVYINFISY